MRCLLRVFVSNRTILGPEPRISPDRLQSARLRLARISGGDNPRKKVQSLVRLSTVTGNTAHYQRIQQLGYQLMLVNWR